MSERILLYGQYDGRVSGSTTQLLKSGHPMDDKELTIGLQYSFSLDCSLKSHLPQESGISIVIMITPL